MRPAMKSEGKAAYQDLIAMKDATEKMIGLLKNARGLLDQIIKQSKDLEGKELILKHRASSISRNPERLVFNLCCLQFYIDFTVSAIERDDDILTKGSIVYGTSRERYGEVKNILEDKPLLEFSVNKNGIVESNRGITGKWWIAEHYKAEDETTEEKEKETKDREKQLNEIHEMHFRAIRHICPKALNWTNEPLLS